MLMLIMDIDKLMMFLIMYDMCNDRGLETNQEVNEVYQHPRKNIGHHKTCRNKVKHYDVPKTSKPQGSQTFKRRC